MICILDQCLFLSLKNGLKSVIFINSSELNEGMALTLEELETKVKCIEQARNDIENGEKAILSYKKKLNEESSVIDGIINELETPRYNNDENTFIITKNQLKSLRFDTFESTAETKRFEKLIAERKITVDAAKKDIGVYEQQIRDGIKPEWLDLIKRFSESAVKKLNNKNQELIDNRSSISKGFKKYFLLGDSLFAGKEKTPVTP